MQFVQSKNLAFGVVKEANNLLRPVGVVCISN